MKLTSDNENIAEKSTIQDANNVARGLSVEEERGSSGDQYSEFIEEDIPETSEKIRRSLGVDGPSQLKN